MKGDLVYCTLSHICHVYVMYMSRMSRIFDSRMRRSRFVDRRQRLIPERCARALIVLKEHPRQIVHVKFRRVSCVSVFWRGWCQQATWQNAARTIVCKQIQVPCSTEGSGSISLLLIETIVNTYIQKHRKTTNNLYLLGSCHWQRAMAWLGMRFMPMGWISVCHI